MVGGITKQELKVLAAAIVWWKELGNKPATDILWEALDDMMLQRKKTSEVKPTKRSKKGAAKKLSR